MSLGNWGQSQLRNAAGSFFGSDYLRDFRHASKTFRTNSYQNAPKFKFLFHTYFDINPDALVGFNSRGVGEINSSTNFGLLVKEVKLPSYTFDTSTLNQYNRKRIIQTKLKYDPVDITFHDDNGDQINQLWEAYYTYYFYDALNPNVQFGGSRGSTGTGPNVYNQRNLYNPTISGDDNWGFNSDSPTGEPIKSPFFKNITVFGFNQHNFTAYTLINPIIANFTHDTYAYSQNDGIMQNRMTITYETVVYNYGALDGRNPGDIVTGFGDEATYDRRTSPISQPGANGTILGQGGIVDGVGGTIDALRRGDLKSAVKNAGTSYNTFKNVDLSRLSVRELEEMLLQSTGQIPNNRNTLFNFPSAGASPGLLGTAGGPVIGQTTQPIIRTEPTSGTQFTGGSTPGGG